MLSEKRKLRDKLQREAFEKFYKNNEPEEALSPILQSNDIANEIVNVSQDLDDLRYLKAGLELTALIHERLNNLEEAGKILLLSVYLDQQLIELIDDSLINDAFLDYVRNLFSLSQIEIRRKHIDDAINYLDQAMIHLENLTAEKPDEENIRMLASGYLEMFNLLTEKNLDDEALAYLNQFISTSLLLVNYINDIQSFIHLFSGYLKKAQWLLDHEKINEALYFLNRDKELMKVMKLLDPEGNFTDLEMDMNLYLSEASSKANDLNSALNYLISAYDLTEKHTESYTDLPQSINLVNAIIRIAKILNNDQIAKTFQEIKDQSITQLKGKLE